MLPNLIAYYSMLCFLITRRSRFQKPW